VRIGRDERQLVGQVGVLEEAGSHVWRNGHEQVVGDLTLLNAPSRGVA
jgi:hypothetical protein